MIDSAHIEIFADSLTRYFTHLNESTGSISSDLEISAPYLISSTDLCGLDYTGVITVSGQYSGKVFVTARNSMLKRILLSLGESDLTEELRRDLIGEVANTLAGNARRYLGADFHISTPKILDEKISRSNFSLSARCFILPFRWKSNVAELVISID